MKVALFSGGKESFYASARAGNVDAYIIFVYRFPEPSPHLVNLGPSVATGLLSGKPVIVRRLTPGKELEESARFLNALGADTIVAGDVYIEDHLKYMEALAREAGASLEEPLWGMEPVELLYKEIEYGLRVKIIGTNFQLQDLLGLLIEKNNVEKIVAQITGRGCDAIGERGEYHTLVVDSPLHTSGLHYNVTRAIKTSRSVLLHLTLLPNTL